MKYAHIHLVKKSLKEILREVLKYSPSLYLTKTGLIRAKIKGKTFCPITFACYMKTGNRYFLNGFVDAANHLFKIKHFRESTLMIITNAADNIITKDMPFLRRSLIKATRKLLLRKVK